MESLPAAATWATGVAILILPERHTAFTFALGAALAIAGAYWLWVN